MKQRLDQALTLVLLGLIRVYQWVFSPFIGNQCRFYPTCSCYAQEALREHGPWHGSWLAGKRLARCHPFAEGGIDLVPLDRFSSNPCPQGDTH